LTSPENTHEHVAQKYLVVRPKDSYAATLKLIQDEQARLPDSYKSEFNDRFTSTDSFTSLLSRLFIDGETRR